MPGELEKYGREAARSADEAGMDVVLVNDSTRVGEEEDTGLSMYLCVLGMLGG